MDNSLLCLTHVGDFWSHDLHHILSKKASQSFSNAYQTNAKLFFKRDQADRYKFILGCPGRILIGYPFKESSNTNTIFYVLSRF